MSALQLVMAESRLGRVALHLIAMCGDREVRFHLAGIRRELPGRLAGGGAV